MSVSQRVTNTINSSIGEVFFLAARVKYNFAVGIPFWTPPFDLLQEATLQPFEPLNIYGPIFGNPSLLNKLKEKVEKKNKLTKREILVTAGANQGFINLCLTLLDPGDEVILFSPFYFNHKMAIQLANAVVKTVPVNLSDESNLIDFDLLEQSITPKTKAVVVVNPSNPTGAVVSPPQLKKLQKVLEEKNIWLISDEAYEDFVFEDKEHFSPDGRNVFNLYSFSKSYGMSGWRCGYIAYPSDPKLTSQLAKVQDTIPIVTSKMTQRMAELALDKLGPSWVKDNVKQLEPRRQLMQQTIHKIFPESPKTSGSFYATIQLPEPINDLHAAFYLAKEHSILVVPTGGCDLKGGLRLAYGYMDFEKLQEGCLVLEKALLALKEKRYDDLSMYYTKD